MSGITAWLAYCFLIGAALTGGAWLWERAGRWSGRAVRWGWLAALCGSVTLPFLLRLVPQPVWPEAVPMVGMVGVVTLEALTISAQSTPGTVSLESVLVGVWVALTLAVLLYTYAVVAGLSESRRRWRAREVDGERVLVSRNVGPAALGVRRGVVVVPGWALELEGDLRRLMLLHEREHVDAGDPRLLLVALLLAAVMPWNPVVWLQVARLRNAVELDCDARVLRRAVDPARYGALLLEVGRRRGGSALVLATFAEPRVFLKERIRRIAKWPLERRPLRAALLSALALALFSTALLARVQSESVLPVAAAAAESRVLEALGLPGVRIEVPLVAVMVSDTPPARPQPQRSLYTHAPRLHNSEDVMTRMNELYPALLRDAGVGGTTTLWVYVTHLGAAQHAQLARSSGHEALDAAALKVAEMMRFAPAMQDRAQVAAWIQVPVTFGALAHTVTVDEQPTAVPQPVRQPEGPHFTPMTRRPELVNQTDVERALVRNYPPLLRDAGVGGTTVMWFYIDERGYVTRTQVSRSSGHPALDEAAARVAQAMQFTPALNRDRDVAVWIEIPIRFAARDREATVEVPPGTVPAQRVPFTQSERQAVEVQAAQIGMMTSQPGMVTSLRIAVDTAASPDRAVQARAIQLREAGGVLTVARPDTAAVTAAVAVRRAQVEALQESQLTKRPELRNAREVEQALARSYPPLLRDAGIGGTAVVYVMIDRTGEVRRLQLHTGSGYEALDRAALTVAASMRFSPPLRGDTPVDAWIEVPIVFTAR